MRPAGRIDAVDFARGVALVAMAGYHLTWDVAYFGLVDSGAPFTPAMRIASHLIGGTFLALAGVSLRLAHIRGFHLRPFALRLLRIVAAAALVTIASFFIAADAPIGFGILHCITVASLLAAPFLSRGAAGATGAGLLGLSLVALPLAVSSPSLDPPWFVWLGLGAHDPPTLDWRPLCPWGGVVLLGYAAAYCAPLPFAHWRAEWRTPRALAFAGRHSLPIYLVHQPLLIGLLWVFTQTTGFADKQSVEAYMKACRPACVEAGGDSAACNRACACVVEGASRAGLAGQLGRRSIAPEERSRIGDIAAQCGSH